MTNRQLGLIGLLGFLKDVDVVIQDVSGKPVSAHVATWWRESARPYLEGIQQGRLPGPLEEEYAVLGLVPFASDDVVRAAYKAMMKQHHPDVEGGDEGTAKRLNEAYGKICHDRGMV
ncbi:hypothetical protein LCGC14_2190370 [marine sediment metagenome]|uniref:J domain-containing protein n=1 Tax=marine sediment metagenome TaxID=412755 RepID=A0A0F9FX42_9ZZZZ